MSQQTSRKQVSGASRNEGSPVDHIKCPHLEFSSSKPMKKRCIYIQLHCAHPCLQAEPGNPSLYVREKDQLSILQPLLLYTTECILLYKSD